MTTTMLPPQLAGAFGPVGGANLSARLTALARLVQIGTARTGPDGFPAEVLAAASDILVRAGERLTLSSHHTVVALGGGTGSGKSSLFNALAGADFSTVGVTRPVTRDAHACVWGVSGSGPLLEWLGVPRRFRYARASALSSGEQSLDGLVLLDLPDHDTVMGHATELVDHLVDMSDLVVWVLDPQKYADAAVHRRFLAPLAGHSEIVAIVLNQSDLLSAGQIEDCVQDLRRLLDDEGLPDTQILVTSARTGAGLEELRKLLTDTVTARQAATARIAADVAKVVERFRPYAAASATDGVAADGSDGSGGRAIGSVNADGFAAYGSAVSVFAADGSAAVADGRVAVADGPRGLADGTVAVVDGRDAIAVAPRALPEAIADELAVAFAAAAGVEAIADSLRSARELRALDYVGWPFAWLTQRVTRRNPARKIRLGKLWDELRGRAAGPSGAQRAEIDNALNAVAAARVPQLPAPWSRTVRTALRSRAADVPGVIGAEIAAVLPDRTAVDRWWRVVGVVQGLLLGCVVVGLAWLGTLIVLGVAKVDPPMPRLFSDVWFIPWAGGLVLVGAVGGWLTARLCARAVRDSAATQTSALVADVRGRLAGVARTLVLEPANAELSELGRFRGEIATAAGDWVAQ